MRINLQVFIAAALLITMCGIVTAATVTQSISFQGKLTNVAGTPLSGTYSVTFTIYDASTGGSALSTDTHSVTATNGLFTTLITVADPTVVDGRALWLGIQVGADPEMTPRQEIRPVPYALGLRPWIVGASFTTNQAGTSWNDLRPGVNVSTSNVWNPGIRIRTTGANSYGITAVTTGSASEGVYAQTSGTASNGVAAYTTGPNSPGVAAVTDGPGSYGVDAYTNGAGSYGVHAHTAGANSPAVYGESVQDVGVYGKGKEGGYFTTNQVGTSWNDLRPGVNVSTANDYNPGVIINTSGYYSHGVYAATTGDYSDGVYAITKGKSSPALRFYTLNTSSEGLWGATFGPNSAGLAVFTHGTASQGVWASTSGSSSHGVVAITTNTSSYGVYARTNGIDSDGIHVETAGLDSGGIHVVTGGLSSDGVHAITTNTSSVGVYAATSGTTSDGVHVETSGPGSYGLNAHTSGTNSQAVHGYSEKDIGIGGYSDNYYAVYGHTARSDQKYGIYTPDYLYAKGTQVPAADVAEYMPVAENVTPGTVLVIGDDGKLQTSTTAYDTKVAGIVSTEPGVALGTKDNGNPGEQIIAVAGRVPCKVDATKSPIHAGDLLTTSDTPGYAMKAEPIDVGDRTFYPSGIVLGKAMGTLESGTGTIEVLVTLQ